MTGISPGSIRISLVKRGFLPLDRKRDDGSRQLSSISRIGLPRTKTLLRVVMIVALMTSMGTLAGCGGLSSAEIVPDDPSAGDTEAMEDMSQIDSYTVAFEDMTRGEGVYVVSADSTKATRLWDDPGHMSVSYFDGADYTVEDADYDGNVRLEGAYIEDIAEDPAYVNISAGEKLALVLPYGPYVRMYEGSCIGYGHYEKSDELTGYEEIAGVDLSDVETIADANERLAGTDLRFYTCTRSSHYDDVLLLSSTRGMQVTAGTYVGTSFEEETYSFDRTFYLFSVTSMQKPEIEKTKDGYFIVDLSAILIILCACLCRDRESLRNREANLSHFCKVCTLTAEKVTHRCVSLFKEINILFAHQQNPPKI